LPFSLLASLKSIGFRWVSRFSLSFRQLLTEKGNLFWWLSLFTMPFSLLASLKSIGFRWVSRFTMPFRQPHTSKPHTILPIPSKNLHLP
jgi:hypothetical protein